MLLNRILSTLVGIPLLLIALWQGSLVWLLVTAFFMIVGQMEFHKLMTKIEVNHSLTLSYLGGLLFLVEAYFNNNKYIGLIITFLVIANLVKMVFFYPKYKALDIGATLLGTFYVGWLFAHVFLIRQFEQGIHFTLLLLFTTFATDTFAYFTGRSFGRHKLAPVLSPKKTIEGSIGGVLGAVLIALLFAIISPQTTVLNYIIISLLVGTFGQVGDLAESVLKRIAGVKDSGKLIPGHGGVLDRVDSILFNAPVVYYFVKLFIIN